MIGRVSLDRGAGCSNILNDHNLIAILDRAAQQDALCLRDLLLPYG